MNKYLKKILEKIESIFKYIYYTQPNVYHLIK